MLTHMTHAAIYVHDQQEALNFYVEKLGFVKKTDAPMDEEGKTRWVTISPQNQPDFEIILQSPDWGPGGTADERRALVGKVPGFVFKTPDCQKDYADLKARGVKFTSEPQTHPWGIQAVFEDL